MTALKSVSYFVAINIASGAMNYLFQVVGARNLSIEDFSRFNEWFAYTSMFAFAGGLLQNAANFYQISHKQMIRQAIFCVVVAVTGLSSVLLWKSDSTVLFTALFIVFATMNGWLTGQSQIRLMYQTMAYAGFALALVKVMLAGSHLWPATTDSYIRIVTLAFVPSIVLLGFRLLKSDHSQNLELKHSSRQVLLAAVAISMSVAIVPQLDILVLSKTQDSSVFEVFIQASIFYKVVFFFFLIFAQWLLPQQTLNHELSIIKKLYTFSPVVLALIASGFLTLISEPVSVWIMNWDPAPPKSYVFFSCINMSLLTWLFLLIQETCARKMAHVAVMATGSLVALGLVQYAGAWEISTYFAINGAVAFLLIVVLLQFLKRTPTATS